MAVADDGRLRAGASLSFEATGGLFGPETRGIDWRVFLGLGSLDGPLRAPFSIGGPVSTWLPFVGDIELMRARLFGELATRVGLEVGLQISPGATRARLPYDVAFSFPDATTLAADPFFRLEGSGVYRDGPDAGFETEWPYFAFDMAAVFELAVLAQLEMGVLGNNTTRKLLDVDIATRLPIVDLDSRDRENPANRTERLFGLDIGEIAAITGSFTPDPEDDDGGPLIDLDIGDTLTVEFDLDGLDFFKSEEKKPERDATEARTADDAKDGADPEADRKGKDGKEKASILDLFETGPLATLDLRLPRIELEDRGTARDLALDAATTYAARTPTAAEAAAIEEQRDRDGNLPDGVADPREAEIARLSLDLDNILTEIVKASIAGPALKKVPGFEGRIDLPLSLGPFSAGAYFDYNLFDADLNFILPVRQDVSVTTKPLQTRLSFSRADAEGNPLLDEGAQAAFFINARAPRYSVYFNEGAAFWDDGVAALLRFAADQSARAAEDVALFADLDGRRIPGAFTGQTGGVAGSIASSTDGGATWIELTTFPEETEWLARSRPVVGVAQRLEDLRPRGDAIFRYFVTDDDTARSAVTVDGLARTRIDAGSAVGSAPLSFQQLLGFGGVFDLRVDAVTAPISTTGFVEGAPSLDLIFPAIPGESVHVDVEHLASAVVANRTTLDFDMTIALSALEFAFGAYVRAFGGRFGLDFAFGPLWEKVYPILSTTLAALYDDRFEVSTGAFTATPVDGAAAPLQERWGFAIGAGGAADPLTTEATDGDDALDAAAIMGRAPGGTPVVDAAIDAGAGVDTLTFARLATPATVHADLSRGAALLGWDTADFDGFVAAAARFNDIDLTADAGQRGAVTLGAALETAALDFAADFVFLRDTLAFEIPHVTPPGESFVDDPTGRGVAFVLRAGSDAPATALFGLPDAAETASLAVVYAESSGALLVLRDGDVDNPLASRSLIGLFDPVGDSLRRMWVDYAEGRLEVRVAQGAPERPAAAMLTLEVDLADILGPRAHLGLAASNGPTRLSNPNRVNWWTVETSGEPGVSPVLETAFDEYRLSGDAANEGVLLASLIRPRGRLFFENVENLTGGRLGDRLVGDAGDNRLDGGEGDDTLIGGGGRDTLIGGPGDDVLIMGDGPDAAGPNGEMQQAFGGDGDDRIYAGSGVGLYDGGTGAPVGTDALIPVDLDVIDYADAPGPIRVDLATGERSGAWIERHTLRNFEGVAGTAYDDVLSGGSGRSYLEGGPGDDVLTGSPLGLGQGLSEAERLRLPGGPDRLYGGEGDDRFIASPGAALYDGGPGRDVVDYSFAPSSVFVDLADGILVDPERFAPLLIPAGTDPADYARIDGRGWRGWAQGDKFRDIEDLIGSVYDDILFGDAGDNKIMGGEGDDRLAGRFGDDALSGEEGDDILWSRAGVAAAAGSFAPVARNPFIEGFETTGTLSLAGGPFAGGFDRLDGGAGRDLAILDWTPGFFIVQPNELVSNYYDDIPETRRAYELRYAAPGLSERLVASLAEGAAWIELFAASDDRTLTVTGARLSPDDPWTDLEGLDSVTFFERVGAGSRVGLPLRQEFGDWFADAPTALALDGPIRIDIATLTGLEGLIARDTPDFLIGTDGVDALYSGGGADLIFAGAGDDVVSFGPGQPPEQIFSFPGRGYAALADLERRLGAAQSFGGAARDPAASDQRIVFTPPLDPGDGTLAQAFDPAGPLIPLTPPETPAAQAEIDALLIAYLAGGRDADAFDALGRALAAADARLADYALIDAGPGRNVLDLRFDRGLDFLNRPGPLAAMVDLEAAATRFLVKPGLAVPGMFADPAASDWTALLAFTSAAPVGEARFLTRPAADSGGVSLAEQRAQMAAQDVRPALLMGVRDLIGTAANDWLFGDAADNVIEGGGGTPVRRLTPEQGGVRATIAVYADWLDGRDGYDALSYANAKGGVTLVLGEQGDGAAAPIETAGDAVGDLFTGFEEIRGSELRDRLGFTGAALPDSPLDRYYARNAIAVVDGGGGNDVLIAARAGVLFDGGAGDDVIEINLSAADPRFNGAWIAVTGRPAPAEGPMVMAVEGGAGVDIARLSGVGLAALALEGDALAVTEVVPETHALALDDPRQATLVTTVAGVEYVEIGFGAARQTLALANLDPVVAAPRTLILPEDPWSARRVFAESGPGAPRPGQTATVAALSAAGVFALDGPDGPVALALGQTLDAVDLARVVFFPNQQFAIPRAGPGDGPQVLAGAELALSFRDGDGPAQPRAIRVEPGEMDGAPLGIAAPTDVAHAPSTVIAADRADRDAEGRPVGDRVRLFQPPDLDAAIAAADATLAAQEAEAAAAAAQLAAAQAALDAASAALTRTERLFEVGAVSAADLAAAQAARAQAAATFEARLAQEATAQEAAAAARGALAALEAEAAAPAVDLPRALAYTVEAVTEGGALWRAADAGGAAPILVERLEPGAVIARAELGDLIFMTSRGALTETDAVLFAPVETLTVTVTEVPDSGFVFNPVIGLGLDPSAPTGAAPDQPATLLEAPADGALFLRGADGARIAVTVGDALDAGQIAGLYFEADIARRATVADPATVAAGLAALNRPTLDIGPEAGSRAPGVGAAPLPADPTALVLQFDLGAPAAAAVDGVTVDMEAAGATRAVAYEGRLTFRGAPLDWRQWRVEDGGDGHFYAIASEGRTTSSHFLYSRITGQDAAAGLARPFELASIGSAAENDFVFGLFADDPTMFRDVTRGPLIGAQIAFTEPDFEESFEGEPYWTWTDGTPWTFTAWDEGQPDFFRNIEFYAHYRMQVVDAEERLYRPTWNDIDTDYGAPGWVLEAPALATERNDVIDGSSAADVIRAGGGDDVLRGGAGDDSLHGGDGRDRLEGGAGDDRLEGGAGDDIFVMTRDGGVDRIADFELPVDGVARDRIDVSALNLRALGQIRITMESATEIGLHAGGQVFILENMGGVDPALLADPLLYIGAPRHVGAVLPGAAALALAPGDALPADELAGLRYRAGQDATGAAGRFAYEVRDPWALPDGIAGLPDPRAPETDGVATGAVAIVLEALNDAPRASDRAHHVSLGAPLDGRAPELRLTATDPEGDAVSFLLVEGPTRGSVTLDPDGGFFYAPDPDPAARPGFDSFRYAVTDGAATSAPYTVSLEILDTSAPRGPEPDEAPVDGFVRLGGLSANMWLRGGPEDNRIDAGPGDDRIEGVGGDNVVDAGSGDDLVRAGEGTDDVTLGPGEDRVAGALAQLAGTRIRDFGPSDGVVIEGVAPAGLSLLVTPGAATLRAGVEAARVALDGIAPAPPVGAAGAGALGPTLRLDPHPAGALLRLADAPFDGVALTDAADRFLTASRVGVSIDAGAGDDVVVSGPGDDVLSGGPGSDLLIGGGGDDVLAGGPGGDVLRGGAGADRFAFDAADGAAIDFIDDFESGADVLAFAGFEGLSEVADLAPLRVGANLVLTTPGGGRVVLRDFSGELAAGDVDFLDAPRASGASAAAEIRLTDGADRFVTRDATGVTVRSGAGDDVIVGGPGNDRLVGEGGANLLIGGAGDDRLEPGPGQANLIGGPGADVFVFDAADAPTPGRTAVAFVEDFTRGEDRVALLGFAGVAGAGDVSFRSVGGLLAIELGTGRLAVFTTLDAATPLGEADFLFG